MDFWASRVHSAKHLSAVQAAQSNNSEYQFMGQDDDDDDARAWFPCPFCYVEVEIPMLCRHLQEEHCFNLKNAVCPICAANLGKDAMEHFTVQHSHSVKRRKSHVACGYNGSRMLVKDQLGEINTFIGPNWESRISGRFTKETTLDPLLSPFFCTINDPKSNQQDELSTITASPASDLQSSTPSILDEAQEEDFEERRQRAAFVQQLIFSTIF